MKFLAVLISFWFLLQSCGGGGAKMQNKTEEANPNENAAQTKPNRSGQTKRYKDLEYTISVRVVDSRSVEVVYEILK